MLKKYSRFVFIGIVAGLFGGVSVMNVLGQSSAGPGVNVGNLSVTGNALALNGDIGVRVLVPSASLDVAGPTFLRGKTVIGGSLDPSLQTNTLTVMGKASASEGFCIGTTCITTAAQLQALGGVVVAPSSPLCGNPGATSGVPSRDLCAVGTASPVQSAGNQWSWSCTSGNTNTFCNSTRIVGSVPAPSPNPTVALCGPANGVPSSTQPTTDVCNPGVSSVVPETPTGWNWDCTYEGSRVSCGAPKIISPPIPNPPNPGGAPVPNPSAQSPEILSVQVYKPQNQTLPKFEVRWQGVTNYQSVNLFIAGASSLVWVSRPLTGPSGIVTYDSGDFLFTPAPGNQFANEQFFVSLRTGGVVIPGTSILGPYSINQRETP